MDRYSSKTEYIDKVLVPTLGTTADDFDLEGIANECLTLKGEEYVDETSDGEFWKIVRKHDTAV